MSDQKTPEITNLESIRARLATVKAGEPVPTVPEEPKGPNEYLYEFIIDNPNHIYGDPEYEDNPTSSEYWEGYLIVTQTFVACARGRDGEILFFVPVSRLHMVKLAEDPDELVETA